MNNQLIGLFLAVVVVSAGCSTFEEGFVSGLNWGLAIGWFEAKLPDEYDNYDRLISEYNNLVIKLFGENTTLIRY